MQDQPDSKRPTLLIIRGLPGSGKTYLAAELQKSFSSVSPLMLDPDATDHQSAGYAAYTKNLTAEGVDAALHPYRFLRAQAYRGIEESKLIIWNQPFTNLGMFDKMIAGLQNYAEEHGEHLQLLVVEVEIDPAIARQRVIQRKLAGGHGPSDDTFASRVADYGSFASHGYPTLAVQGEADVSQSVAMVKDALYGLWAETSA
jgi:predicted ABC-type ATPase